MNKISIFSIISVLISILAFISYVMLLAGTDIFALWIILSIVAILFPILSKYFRKRKAKKGNGLEIAALVIGAFDFYFVFFAATKINLFFVFILIASICFLYAKSFNNIQVVEKSTNEKIEKLEEVAQDEEKNDPDSSAIFVTPVATKKCNIDDDTTEKILQVRRNGSKRINIKIKLALTLLITLSTAFFITIFTTNYIAAPKKAENAAAIYLAQRQNILSDKYYHFMSFEQTYYDVELSDFKYVVELSGSAKMGPANKTTTFSAEVEINPFTGSTYVSHASFNGNTLK
ncbi:MAG: hypothetical protein U0M42_09035 [Acutalibacteraceae bacterium]|nr:hypothetical protein [Acutalibacteraceae bacterium]